MDEYKQGEYVERKIFELLNGRGGDNIHGDVQAIVAARFGPNYTLTERAAAAEALFKHALEKNCGFPQDLVFLLEKAPTADILARVLGIMVSDYDVLNREAAEDGFYDLIKIVKTKLPNLGMDAGRANLNKAQHDFLKQDAEKKAIEVANRWIDYCLTGDIAKLRTGERAFWCCGPPTLILGKIIAEETFPAEIRARAKIALVEFEKTTTALRKMVRPEAATRIMPAKKTLKNGGA